MKTSSKTKVLFFANIPVHGIKASIGGATTLAEAILKFLEKEPQLEVKQKPIRTIWKPKWHIIEHLLWMVRFPFVIRKYDVVSFHSTWDFSFTTAPFVWLWAKWMKKRTVFHNFANFHTHFDRKPNWVKKLVIKTYLNSDVVFFETKESMEYFSKQNLIQAKWLPNARKPILEKLEEKKFTKKFVFISQVISCKGVSEIIGAAENLPDDYVVDVYGPIDDRYFNQKEFDGKKAQYKGVLKPEQVIGKLKEYDVLVVPTWCFGEGYPGIIIEALSLGMPVISTAWSSIPEVVEDRFNGRLIEIKNLKQLEDAMLEFNDDNFQSYRENAFKSFDQFNSDLVFKKFVKAYLNEPISQ